MNVSADFLRLCGANAIQGRTFTTADDLPNAPEETAVLAYAVSGSAIWRRFPRDWQGLF